MPQAQRDAKSLKAGGLKNKALKLVKIIAENPWQYPPGYEYLKGDLKGLISRRINRQHRLVYEIIEDEKLVKVYRMWTHYFVYFPLGFTNESGFKRVFTNIES